MEIILAGILALVLFGVLIAGLEVWSRRQTYMEKPKETEPQPEPEPTPLLGVAFPPEMEQEELDKREKRE